MINKREVEELVELYCEGKLSEDQLRIFEQWKESDPGMAKAILEHGIIMQAFQVYSDREILREKIASIRNEVETEDFRFNSPLKVVAKEKSNVRKLWKRYRVVAVAAASAIVAVSATILSFNLAGVGPNKNASAYQELRREVENIKRNQKAIINGINTDNKETEILPSQSFTGTGFVLSCEGYLLTSYHVVEDAKKIFISNEKYDQLSVTAIYSDKALDLAVLKVNDKKFREFNDMPYSFKHSTGEPGEKVFTLGFPREDLVYGEGSISSHTGFEGDTASYQISIPVNPGNSGGPLFDGQGNLLGIISGKNAGAEGASFAVKSKWIRDYINDKNKEVNISIPARRNMKGLDRPSQIKKLKEFVFMVKVYN